ncbi:MAG: glycosyltransferase family 2 protein [candidate division WS1 bacterium]|jgi:glycosyltransferase involved in cell wall biosynthesis|nr:glycosyltransferase family 2 protein [candidate division WS1 bacterium]
MDAQNQPDQPQVSIVIPVYNEEETIPHLHDALATALADLDRPWEVVLVNDGSKDRSAEKLDEVAQKDPRFVAIHLRRNFGQTAAMSAGFDHARGEIIVAMDADLQNDPADVPKLLAKMDEGYDVVSGWRKDRKDKWLTRIFPSQVANWLISRVTGVYLHDYGCSLKSYRREILDDVQLYGEMHRFIPALARWAGASITEVVVTHHPRQFGSSKYGLSRTLRVFLDLLTVKFLLSYVTRPIQVFGKWGLLSGAVGFLLALWLTIDKLAFGHDIGNRPALLLAVLLIVVGFQFVTMGLLAELQARTYYEAQGKPIYAIRRITRG